MAVNYDDSRFQQVEEEKNQAINETTNQYNQMINNTDSMYQQQIDASKEWANKQSELQQAQTDFAIEKVEQSKEKAQKDYIKEQKAAYTDYQKATDQYGANAETIATQGLTRSGYSESAKTSMYNTYQNRYMTARESFNNAILNYDNSIKEAQLANSSALAQIAYESLQKQLELSLQGFQYKNTLVQQKLDAVNAQKDRYYQRYQNVLQQINTENALAEQIRQYNETMTFNKQKAAQEQANWEKQYALSKASASRSSSSSGGSSGSASLTNNSSDSLSENGNKVYETAAKIMKSNANSSREETKKMATNYVADAYRRGGLSDNELVIISKKLGFE